MVGLARYMTMGYTEPMTETECSHRRQVRLADMNEWVCEDCMALMDVDNPNVVLAR